MPPLDELYFFPRIGQGSPSSPGGGGRHPFPLEKQGGWGRTRFYCFFFFNLFCPTRRSQSELIELAVFLLYASPSPFSLRLPPFIISSQPRARRAAFAKIMCYRRKRGSGLFGFLPLTCGFLPLLLVSHGRGRLSHHVVVRAACSVDQLFSFSVFVPVLSPPLPLNVTFLLGLGFEK